MRIHEVKLTPKMLKKLDFLDAMTFPTDERYPKENRWWWLAEDNEGPIGFAGLEELNHNTGFLCRAGVFQRFAGRGVHRHLIQVREKAARKMGFEAVVTHVQPDNYKSANNLIRCGYRLIKPFSGFWFDKALHFKKEL